MSSPVAPPCSSSSNFTERFSRKGIPRENVPFLDRFSVDVGAVDNRTGREEVSAVFKLGGQLYLVGDVDVTGAFAGRVRYLVRFR